MAHRDRSQGFGFVYLDLAKFISERDELEKKHYPPLDVPSVNFNKDSNRPAASITPLRPTPPVTPRNEAITQIRENLDRLQTLHHKLHAMLEELNTITGKKKTDEKE